MVAPLRLRSAFAAATLSAALFVPGLPPLALWPAVLVSFAPLYLAIGGQAPRRALAIGWFGGVVATAAGFSWLIGTLREFGELSFPAAAAILLGLSVWNGGRLGVAAWLSARAEQRGWPAAPTFLLAFVTSELLYPLLFPWYVATAADHALPLLQPAELGGPLLVDLLMLVPSVALGHSLRRWRAGWLPSAPVVAVGVAVPLLTAAWGSLRMADVRGRWEAAPALRVGLVQPNIATRADASVEELRAHTLRLAEEGAGLVVWPETAIHTSYNDLTYPDTIPAQVTHDLGVPVLFGVRMWRLGATEEAPRIRHNTVLLAGADGSILGRYDKHVLVPFGEYTPFGEVVPALAKVLRHTGTYVAGEGPQPLEWDGHRVLALVCYEDILAGYVNEQVRATDPDLLVNVTNDAWFGDSPEPWIHLGEARLRAIEHRRFLVRATNSGPSGVVDATGAGGVSTEVFEATTAMGTVRFLRSRTLYERVGDSPFWLGAALSLLAAFVRRPAP